MNYYAHSGLKRDYSDWQPLATHLQNVANLAASFAKAAQPTRLTDNKEELQGKTSFYETAQLAGLLHDLGKYRSEFQQYLKKERERSIDTVHSVYGAAAMGYRFDDIVSAFAIAGHHAGLHDKSGLAELIGGSKYKAEQRYTALLNLAEKELSLCRRQGKMSGLID